jgi:hypothetical protein
MISNNSKMKKLLKTSQILSWVNLLSGSLLILGGIMAFLLTPAIFTIILAILLPGAVILHSYATIQLRKSIMYPGLPLNRQTAAGIRLMGFMALFFAIMSISNAILILQHTKETAELIKLPVQAKNMDIVPILRASGIFTLVVGLSIVANIMLSFRLLKWYLLQVQRKDGSE